MRIRMSGLLSRFRSYALISRIWSRFLWNDILIVSAEYEGSTYLSLKVSGEVFPANAFVALTLVCDSHVRGVMKVYKLMLVRG